MIKSCLLCVLALTILAGPAFAQGGGGGLPSGMSGGGSGLPSGIDGPRTIPQQLASKLKLDKARFRTSVDPLDESRASTSGREREAI